ncbi:MAG: VOC family protein [Flavipsychrobacter sp.]|nr:VOC family protein [Flavipsychrobacter sp.]
MENNQPGQILWHDLTVPDATAVSAFYHKVLGWDIVPLSMGDYNDYCMNDAGGNTQAGICHARGGNAYLPPQWIMYVSVANLDKSLEECISSGGKIIGEKRKMGNDGKLYCLVQDPAGAYVMLCG